MLQESTTILSSIKTVAGQPYENTILGLAVSRQTGWKDGVRWEAFCRLCCPTAGTTCPRNRVVGQFDPVTAREGLHLLELLTREQESSSLVLCQATVSVFTKTRRRLVCLPPSRESKTCAVTTPSCRDVCQRS